MVCTWLLQEQELWLPSPHGCCWLQRRQYGCLLVPQATESERESHPVSVHASQPTPKAASCSGIFAVSHSQNTVEILAETNLHRLGNLQPMRFFLLLSGT